MSRCETENREDRGAHGLAWSGRCLPPALSHLHAFFLSSCSPAAAHSVEVGRRHAPVAEHLQPPGLAHRARTRLWQPTQEREREARRRERSHAASSRGSTLLRSHASLPPPAARAGVRHRTEGGDFGEGRQRAPQSGGGERGLGEKDGSVIGS